MFRLFVVILFSICIAEETIKYAAVIYRHGDRTPVDFCPTDPYRNASFWPERLGELTNIGKQQHYAFGQWLRRRYSHLLSRKFDPTEIYVRSTDVDRTLMSAQANLAGMYPPVGKSIWNKDIMWQPIPVHTKPEKDDEVLAMKKNCSAYNKEMERLINSKTYKERLSKYQPLMNYMTAYTGRKIKDYDDILSIYTTLKIESLYNMTLPSWTKPVFPDKIREPACYSFGVSAATPLLARLQVGPLLKDIMKKVKHAQSPKNYVHNATKVSIYSGHDMTNYVHNATKVSIYSGHDITIGDFLTALGLFDGICPEYTSSIFIELIYDNSTSSEYIRISYRNSHELVEPVVLSIPYCGMLCPVERFTTLYKNLLTVNFDEECNPQKISAVVGVSCLLGVVFLVAVYVAIKLQSRSPTQHGSTYNFLASVPVMKSGTKLTPYFCDTSDI